MRWKNMRGAWRATAGASLSEYALIAGLVSVLAIGAVQGLGMDIRSAFQSPASQMRDSLNVALDGHLTSAQRAQKAEKEAKEKEEKGPAMILVVDTGISGGTGNQFTLALGGAVNAEVNWGNGAPESCPTVITSGGLHTCEYGRAGVYTIEVTGDVEMFGHATQIVPNITRLVEVRSWGDLGIRRLNRAFHRAYHLTSVPSRAPVGLTTLDSTFQDTTRFNDPDLSSWDVSQVTDLTATFSNSAFNQPLGSWDVSNVTRFYGTFQNSSFNQDIGNWDVSSGTTFYALFRNNAAFNQDLSDWDMSSAISTNLMFGGAAAFDQDISGWNVGNATSMVQMFSGARAFNQDLSGWCVARIASKPGNFDQNTTAWNLPKPVWGRACN